VQTLWIRRLAGVAGLLAVVGLVAGPDVTAAPKDDADVIAKAIEADIAFLQKGLEKAPEKRALPTLKAAALNLALNGSGELREGALKVAEAVGKKDFAAAKATAAKFTPAAGEKGDPAKLAATAKYELADVMSAYRAEKVGGMNLEKDIKAQSKKATDPKLAEVIAGRSIALADYTLVLPSEKAAANPGNKTKWEEYSKGQIKAAQEVAAEAAKGAAADKAVLAKKMAALDASCVACHNEFRD
jgi:hypothetical protein